MSIVLALALQSSPAAGADFQTRVTQAKLAEGADPGPAYQKQMWDRIGKSTTDAYRSCLSSTADKAPFTLVADVLADGRLSHLAVSPQTPAASCMAGQFTSWTLPAPPASPVPYPVEIDFSIKP